MKLSRVVLKFAYRVPGADDKQALTDLNENNVLSDGKPIEMRYDRETHSLVFGADKDSGIAWDNVICWERADLELVCLDCGEDFRSAAGLASHKRFCGKEKEQ